MKSHLKLVPTIDMGREEWLVYRHQGIGASEVGIILGLDDYTSSLELFHYKIGSMRKFDTEGMAQFMGREHEDMIAGLWQYWDGDEQSMIQNFRQGTIVRKCQRVNAYVHNPKYPWLFVSLDRKINKQGERGEGTLELKTISGFEADKWAAGLPPKYVTQVQTQMAVCEFGWGEMAILQDGRKLSVLPFDLHPGIVEHVITKTKAFWDKVLEGRKIVNELYIARANFNQRLQNNLQAELDQLEPEPDGTVAYAQYLSDKFNKPRYPDRKGTEQELQWAITQHEISEKMKAMATEKILVESELKRAMGDYQVLDFGMDGKVYWAPNSNGSRTFRNKIKNVAEEARPL